MSEDCLGEIVKNLNRTIRIDLSIDQYEILVVSISREMVETASKKSKTAFLNFLSTPFDKRYSSLRPSLRQVRCWEKLLKMSVWITAPFGFVLDDCLRENPRSLFSDEEIKYLRANTSILKVLKLFLIGVLERI